VSRFARDFLNGSALSPPWQGEASQTQQKKQLRESYAEVAGAVFKLQGKVA